MSGVPRAIAIGGMVSPYHPLPGVQEELAGILEPRMAVTFTFDHDALIGARLAEFDLCVSYIDDWSTPATSEQTAGLLAFVAQGGGLLVLHNGISVQSRPELAHLVGAVFTGHPEFTTLPLSVSAPSHPVVAGIGAFELDDEPYRFAFDAGVEETALLHYAHEGRVWPAAWAHGWGLGRVVYLMPGHTAASFRNPTYRKLVAQAAGWAGRVG